MRNPLIGLLRKKNGKLGVGGGGVGRKWSYYWFLQSKTQEDIDLHRSRGFMWANRRDDTSKDLFRLCMKRLSLGWRMVNRVHTGQ